MDELIAGVKRKREFSGLPDSIVSRALDLSGGDVKDARALLRKYFGVFLTNKVLRGRDAGVLTSHMSSKKRDYKIFYEKIFEVGRGLDGLGEDSYDCRRRQSFKSVVDLGCGANGFSYEYFPKGICYAGVEASGQLVESTNEYFRERGFEDAYVVQRDLFDLDFVLKILKSSEKPRIVFMFQIVDALENLERDFSKKFILEVSRECENIVLSLPTESLGGRKKFAVQRKWIMDFLMENFLIEKDFEMNGERIICFCK